MSVSVRQVRAAAPTSPGLQSFEVAGFGTPKAAMFIVTAATTEAISTNGAAIACGITDGSSQFSISASSQDGPTNAVCRNYKSNTGCIALLTTTGSLDAVAVFSAWTANGVQINWTNAPATAVLVTVILFGGADLSVYAGAFQASDSIGVNTTVTAPNFQADQLMVLGSVASSWDAVLSNASMQIGFADRGATISQCCSSWYATDGAGSSFGSNIVSNAFVSENGIGSTAIEITAFSATGFTAITRIAGSQLWYPYLALRYATANGAAGHSAFVVDSPTNIVPPAKSVTTTFKPQFVLQLPTGATVTSTAILQSPRQTSATGAGSYGIAAFSAFANEIFSSSIGDDDQAGFMDTESFSSSTFRCRSDTKTNLHLATFGSFNPTNWTLNYSVASSTVRRWATMVIGEFVAGGGGPVAGEAVLQSNFSVVAAGRMTYRATAIVSIVGSAAAVGREVYAGQAALASAWSVSAVGLVTRRGTAMLSSTFTISAAGRFALPGQSILAGVFSLGASPTGFVGGTAILASTFTMNADSSVTFAATGELAGTFDVAAEGTIVASAAAALSSGFTVEAVATSIHAAEATLAAIFSVDPLGSVVYQVAATVAAEFTVSAVGSKASEAPTTWNDYGVPRLYRAAKNAGLSFGLQVEMRAVAGGVNARLYNDTDNLPVSGSDLFTASTAFVLQTTPALALADNKYYVAQLARSVGGTGEVRSAVPAVV
jgi:hypothetical protein